MMVSMLYKNIYQTFNKLTGHRDVWHHWNQGMLSLTHAVSTCILTGYYLMYYGCGEFCANDSVSAILFAILVTFNSISYFCYDMRLYKKFSLIWVHHILSIIILSQVYVNTFCAKHHLNDLFFQSLFVEATWYSYFRLWLLTFIIYEMLFFTDANLIIKTAGVLIYVGGSYWAFMLLQLCAFKTPIILMY